MLPEAFVIPKKSETRQSLGLEKQVEKQSNGVGSKRKRADFDTSAADDIIHKQDKIARLTEPTSQITLKDSTDGSILIDD